MPPARTSRKRDDFYRDRRRRKVCAFCADKTVQIDYKEVNRLRRYLSERAKIEPRRKTGTCAGHQRELSRGAEAGAPRRAASRTRRSTCVLRLARAAAAPSGDGSRAAAARGRDRRGCLRVAAGAGRRPAHRAAPDHRVRAAAARGGRRLARLRHRDQQRVGRRLPPASPGQPPPRHGPRAVHRPGSRRGRGHRVPRRRATVGGPVRGDPRLRGVLDASGGPTHGLRAASR